MIDICYSGDVLVRVVNFGGPYKAWRSGGNMEHSCSYDLLIFLTILVDATKIAWRSGGRI